MASFSGFGAHRALKAPMLSRRGGFAHAELLNYLRLTGKPRGPYPCGDMWRARWRYMGLELRTPVKNDGFNESFLLSPERKGIGLYANGEAAGGRSDQGHSVPPGPGAFIAAGVWPRGGKAKSVRPAWR